MFFDLTQYFEIYAHAMKGVPGAAPLILRGTSNQRETFPLLSNPHLAIISLRITSMPSTGSSPVMAFHHLSSYIPNNINLIEIEYNLGTPQGLTEYAAEIQALMTRIESGDLSRCVSLICMFWEPIKQVMI